MGSHKEYYLYMEPFLQAGNETAIGEAKKVYRRMYKAKWKKDNRRKNHEVSLSYTDPEFQRLKVNASAHSLPVATFIKQSVEAYSSKTYLTLERDKIQKILQLLKMIIIHIEDMREDDGRPLEGFLFAIQKLEQDIRVACLSPLELYLAIQKHIAKDSQNKSLLMSFILSL